MKRLFSFTSESFRSLVNGKSGCQIFHSRRERKGVNFPELQVRKVEKNDVNGFFILCSMANKRTGMLIRYIRVQY